MSWASEQNIPSLKGLYSSYFNDIILTTNISKGQFFYTHS